MDEIGCTCKLDMVKNLKQLQNDLNLFLKALGEMLLSWGCFWSFLVLEGATGVTASLNMEEIRCTRILDMGKNLKQLQNDLNHFLKALGEMPLSFWSFWGYDRSP